MGAQQGASSSGGRHILAAQMKRKRREGEIQCILQRRGRQGTSSSLPPSAYLKIFVFVFEGESTGIPTRVYYFREERRGVENLRGIYIGIIGRILSKERTFCDSHRF
jgi:hypothetical protein